MKHEADYEDGGSQARGDGIVFQTGYQAPPTSTMTVHRRLDIRTFPERVEDEIAELRRRVAALEDWRCNHDG